MSLQEGAGEGGYSFGEFHHVLFFRFSLYHPGKHTITNNNTQFKETPSE